MPEGVMYALIGGGVVIALAVVFVLKGSLSKLSVKGFGASVDAGSHEPPAPPTSNLTAKGLESRGDINVTQGRQGDTTVDGARSTHGGINISSADPQESRVPK